MVSSNIILRKVHFVSTFYLTNLEPLKIRIISLLGKMVESKKALPKEPRLGYYNGYGPGPMPFGPFSPPGPPRYPTGIYGTGGQYPYGTGPRSYGPTAPHGYGGYPHPYSGYDRESWMHEQYGNQSYNSAFFNSHRTMGNSNAQLDNSFSSAGGTYGYDHHTEMKYYHSSPQQDSKYNSSNEDRHNGNTSSLMPGSYSQRMKGTSEEIPGQLEGSLNNSGFSNRFNNSFEESFHKGVEPQNKRSREYAVGQALDSNQTNNTDKSYEAYLREDCKFFNGHNFSSDGGSYNNRSSSNTTGGNFNNLGYSSSRSSHSNPFGSINRRQLYDNATNAPYSTSAGSGGSGENSASSHGYEDDFPELNSVGSKFNNLRLDTDQIEAPNSGINATLTGNHINVISDPQATVIGTKQPGRHALNDQIPAASLSHCNGHVSLTQQGSSRFVSF